MTKALIALTAFVGAISLSIFVFASKSRATLISTIESPDKTYLLHLRGKKSRPTVPLIEHSVYFDLYRNGKPIVWGRKMHTGDWFDPAFENLFGGHTWVDSSTFMFARRQGLEGGRDILNLTNNTSKPIKFLQVNSNDLFLLFDLKAQAKASLSASPQLWMSWITVEGEFEDGTDISRKGVNFIIGRDLKGPFTYEITISADGPVISSSELPVYAP